MNIEINIPESLNDITLQQYQNFLLIEEPTNDDLLSCFLDLDIKAINNIKASEIDRLVIHINSLFEVEQQHQLKFDLNGVSFGFIPNLDAITYGENKDVTTYVNDWQKMNMAMAVLYRPIKQKQGHKYIIEDYNGTQEYSELMKQMPLSVVLGSMVFFYHLTNELLNCIPNYLEKEMEKQTKNGEISEQNGEAIKSYVHSLKATLAELSRGLKTSQSIQKHQLASTLYTDV
jgi:hypothetical protein